MTTTIDWEKVIKGLECCIASADEACPKECPFYKKCLTDDMPYMPVIRAALELLKKQEAERSDWISVNERMPVELHSIFWPWYGKKEWSNAMWREQSDKVLVTIAFKDGTRIVSTGETHDGVWNTAISRTLDPIVTHWMQFPELPMEGNK